MTQNDPIYHWEIQQGTPEWNDIRRGLITSSSMKKLITPTGKIADNDTSRGYLFELACQRMTGQSGLGYSSELMERGTELEPFARAVYHEKVAPVRECGFVKIRIGDGYVGFSPDGLVGDDGMIEIKSRVAKHYMNTVCKGTMPDEHVIQVQTGLWISGRQWCDFITYLPGLPYCRVRVKRNEDLIRSIDQAAKAGEDRISSLIEEFREVTKDWIPTEFISTDITTEDIEF
jgi:hypothetical protein